MSYGKIIRKFLKGALFGGCGAVPTGSLTSTSIASLITGILNAGSNWLKHRESK